MLPSSHDTPVLALFLASCRVRCSALISLLSSLSSFVYLLLNRKRFPKGGDTLSFVLSYLRLLPVFDIKLVLFAFFVLQKRVSKGFWGLSFSLTGFYYSFLIKLLTGCQFPSTVLNLWWQCFGYQACLSPFMIDLKASRYIWWMAAPQICSII